MRCGLRECDEPYVYVLVRSDLPAPQLTVQACHAVRDAALAYDGAGKRHPNLVLLGIANEAELSAAAQRLTARGIPFRSFREDDLDNQLTALATGPLVGAARKFFSNFRLLRSDDYARSA